MEHLPEDLGLGDVQASGTPEDTHANALSTMPYLNGTMSTMSPWSSPSGRSVSESVGIARSPGQPSSAQWPPMGAMSASPDKSSLSRMFNSKLSLVVEDTEPGMPPRNAYDCSLEQMENDTIRGVLDDATALPSSSDHRTISRRSRSDSSEAMSSPHPSTSHLCTYQYHGGSEEDIFGLELGNSTDRASGRYAHGAAYAQVHGYVHDHGAVWEDAGSPVWQSSPGGSEATGEHPLGEHPSRTLFVRNINSNADDDEVAALFSAFGEIRNMYTACKHRGFVMVSYYDIRAARNAMRALQGRPLRRRKLDIHYSIPKENPSDKDVNQGTLVVFNLDASVTNEELRVLFAEYGEVKEIRETPHKRHHKFVEFYDARGAEAALKGLNRTEVKGKRIKLEPSRPGGTRRGIGAGGAPTTPYNPRFTEDEMLRYAGHHHHEMSQNQSLAGSPQQMPPPLPPVSMPVPFGARMHGPPNGYGYGSAPSMGEASPRRAASTSGYYSYGAGSAVWSGYSAYSSSPREIFGSPDGHTNNGLGYSPGVLQSAEYSMQSERSRSGEHTRTLSSWEAAGSLGGGEAGGPSSSKYAAVAWPALGGGGGGGGGGGVWGAVPAAEAPGVPWRGSGGVRAGQPPLPSTSAPPPASWRIAAG